MVVKSARRYITALDKILKSQHNDITTKIVEFNDDNIEYITLNFFIDSKQCFVAAYDYDDIVEYHVDGIDGVIEYKIGDNETHKHSIYTILNRIYDLIVKLEEENNKTKKYYANYSSEDCIVNPEWHHVSLATLANIDFDMLDEKRKLVVNINQILKDGIRNLYKCENHISFEVLERYVIRKCDELIRHNRLKAFWFSYIARQLDEVRRNTIYLYTPYITAHRNRW